MDTVLSMYAELFATLLALIHKLCHIDYYRKLLIFNI
ncbi:hypothetical protein ACIRA0001_0175, partial [Acinetobacter radioresistens SK82]